MSGTVPYATLDLSGSTRDIYQKKIIEKYWQYGVFRKKLITAYGRTFDFSSTFYEYIKPVLAV